MYSSVSNPGSSRPKAELAEDEKKRLSEGVELDADELNEVCRSLAEHLQKISWKERNGRINFFAELDPDHRFDVISDICSIHPKSAETIVHDLEKMDPDVLCDLNQKIKNSELRTRTLKAIGDMKDPDRREALWETLSYENKNGERNLLSIFNEHLVQLEVNDDELSKIIEEFSYANPEVLDLCLEKNEDGESLWRKAIDFPVTPLRACEVLPHKNTKTIYDTLEALIQMNEDPYSWAPYPLNEPPRERFPGVPVKREDVNKYDLIIWDDDTDIHIKNLFKRFESAPESLLCRATEIETKKAFEILPCDDRGNPIQTGESGERIELLQASNEPAFGVIDQRIQYQNVLDFSGQWLRNDLIELNNKDSRKVNAVIDKLSDLDGDRRRYILAAVQRRDPSEREQIWENIADTNMRWITDPFLFKSMKASDGNWKDADHYLQHLAKKPAVTIDQYIFALPGMENLKGTHTTEFSRITSDEKSSLIINIRCAEWDSDNQKKVMEAISTVDKNERANIWKAMASSHNGGFTVQEFLKVISREESDVIRHHMGELAKKELKGRLAHIEYIGSSLGDVAATSSSVEEIHFKSIIPQKRMRAFSDTDVSETSYGLSEFHELLNNVGGGGKLIKIVGVTPESLKLTMSETDFTLPRESIKEWLDHKGNSVTPESLCAPMTSALPAFRIALLPDAFGSEGKQRIWVAPSNIGKKGMPSVPQEAAAHRAVKQLRDKANSAGSLPELLGEFQPTVTTPHLQGQDLLEIGYPGSRLRAPATQWPQIKQTLLEQESDMTDVLKHLMGGGTEGRNIYLLADASKAPLPSYSGSVLLQIGSSDQESRQSVRETLLKATAQTQTPQPGRGERGNREGSGVFR